MQGLRLRDDGPVRGESGGHHGPAWDNTRQSRPASFFQSAVSEEILTLPFFPFPQRNLEKMEKPMNLHCFGSSKYFFSYHSLKLTACCRVGTVRRLKKWKWCFWNAPLEVFGDRNILVSNFRAVCFVANRPGGAASRTTAF